MWSLKVSGVLLLAGLSGFLPSFSRGATITGTVKGVGGAPFAGAFVEVQNVKTKITVDVLSNKEGRYRVEKLPGGEYELRMRAIGYQADPRRDVALTADQVTSIDFALRESAVRWSDLSLFQAIKLLPDGKGKPDFVRICLACHGFESRMAAVQRDEDGWHDRVNYMRNTMFTPLLRMDDQRANDIASYLISVFGPDSTLPRSPTTLPGYKDVQLHFNDESTKIVYVEYDLPGPSRFPWDPNPDKAGNIWIPYYSQVNGVARLDPNTGQVDEFKIPEQRRASIHSAFPAPDGTVWFTEEYNNRIGLLDPATKEVTEYQDVLPPADATGGPGQVPSKNTARVDPRGLVWSSGHPLSSFDPKTKKFTLYPEPASTYGIALDKDGSHVWYTEFTPSGKIYERDTRTGVLVGSWAPPTAGLPRRIQVADDGIVWFGEYNASKIGRFDPRTQTFKEFPLPLEDSTPYALAIDREGKVWYSSYLPDVLGRLDPDTGKVTIYPFPHFENTMRELNMDAQGRMWWTSPANNKVGYFYLAEGNK